MHHQEFMNGMNIFSSVSYRPEPVLSRKLIAETLHIKAPVVAFVCFVALLLLYSIKRLRRKLKAILILMCVLHKLDVRSFQGGFCYFLVSLCPL